MKHELIIIPDVHGREFWKAAIPFIEAGSPAVFLGDYTDPYSSEGIGNGDAVKNLSDIIDVTRAHKGMVSLLVGNHDLSYFGMKIGLWSVSADRYCKRCAKQWHRLFVDNADLFSVCKLFRIRGRRFLLSHAGIHPEWVNGLSLFDQVDQNDLQALASKMDELFECSLHSTVRTDFMEALSVVGYMRGGVAPAGSPVWADCHEYVDVTYAGVKQIFGHTQQITLEDTGKGLRIVPAMAFVTGGNYCIDCRRCFFLDGNGDLRYLDTNDKV